MSSRHELRYTATDPLGLSASRSHELVPDCDRNLNGTPDADEIVAAVPAGHLLVALNPATHGSVRARR